MMIWSNLGIFYRLSLILRGEIPQDIDGKSLKESLLMNQELDRDYLHGEHAFHSKLSNQFIVTKTDKYVWYSETGVQQYFDLEKDPKELINEIDNPIYQERINELKNLLINELEGRPEGFVKNNDLVVIDKPVDTLD